ncbi:MAG: hypothetical protein WC082_11640 [Victivallales bacterium]
MTRKQKLRYWKKILSCQTQSGKSLCGFCRDEKINYKTALHWRDLIDIMSKDEISAPVKIFELPSAAPPQKDISEVPGALNPDAGIKLQFGNGIRLKFPEEFDRDIFWRIMTLLREAKSC